MFFGMFMVFVLPLALVVGALSVHRGDFGKSILGKFVEVALYAAALLSILCSLIFIFKIF